MWRSGRTLPIPMFRGAALLCGLLSLTYCGDSSNLPTGPTAPSADLSPQMSESADAAQSQDPDGSLGGAFGGLHADLVINNGLLFLPQVCDVDGPNDEPAQSDVNCFTRADNLAGHLGVQWSWDDTDVWTGEGQTGDACALFDTNGDGNADYAICVRISNTPDGSDIFQLPSEESPRLYECSDKKTERCSKPTSVLAEVGETHCAVDYGPEGFPLEGDDGQDVVATCDIDLIATPLASNTNLLNVCSFPSGEPNSNPFDCVVTPGAGFIRIEKVATPATTTQFDFTLSPASADGTSAYQITGSGSSALIPVIPDDGPYSVTESIPTNWQLDNAACVPAGSSSFNNTDAVSGIQVQTGITTVCTFENSQLPPDISVSKSASPNAVPETGGEVTYTVVVTNHSLEAVTLDSLVDDKFGDLSGKGDCVVGQTLAAAGQSGDSYSCSFTESLSGAAGDSHTNTVTAAASDDEGNSASDDDDATVTFAGP